MQRDSRGRDAGGKYSGRDMGRDVGEKDMRERDTRRHVGERHAGSDVREKDARERAWAWIFASAETASGLACFPDCLPPI